MIVTAVCIRSANSNYIREPKVSEQQVCSDNRTSGLIFLNGFFLPFTNQILNLLIYTFPNYLMYCRIMRMFILSSFSPTPSEQKVRLVKKRPKRVFETKKKKRKITKNVLIIYYFLTYSVDASNNNNCPSVLAYHQWVTN